MLPTEMYSGDAVPQVPWKPQVWLKGPDQLVAEARAVLWGHHSNLNATLGGGNPAAMAGDVPQPDDPDNDEELINSGGGRDSAGGASRAGMWQQGLAELHQDDGPGVKASSPPWSANVDSPNPPL
jgi:hypothetical protein